MSRRKNSPQKSSEKLRDAGEAKRKSGVAGKMIFVVLLLALLFAGATAAYKKNLPALALDYIYPYSEKEFRVYGEIKSLFDGAEEKSADAIKKREPVYVLDVDTYVSPKPDAARYDENFENYSDSTIEVHYHKERLYDSWVHFMEVRIKHPSQLRMALANDKFGSSRKKPSAISADVNAVAAVNGCFYNRRSIGVLIYKRNILRNRPFGVDVLLIDSEGDFHIVNDKELMSSGLLEQYDIVSGLSFGPELVRDGQELINTKLDWEPVTLEPRTAICQYDDPLHYLVVLCEGRNSVSKGVKLQTFAHEIASRGVRNAYNLDGGQSGTMVIGNKVKNRGGWGPEKAQSDILYFATGVSADEAKQP